MRFLFGKKTGSNYQLVISISAAELRLLILKEKPNKAPELIVNDVERLQNNNITQALSNLNERYKKLSLDDAKVTFVLQLAHYQSTAVDRPDVPDEDLAASLRFQLDELTEMSPDQMITDYYELPLQASGQDKVTAVVAPKELLANIVDAVAAQSWQLTDITVSEVVLKNLFQHREKPCMVLYGLSQNRYVAQIYRAGKLVFTRELRGVRDLSKYSVEEIKLGALEPLATEIQRSMDYYEGQLRQAGLREVVLAVAGPQREAMAESLHELLAVDVELFEYPQWMNELCEGDFSDLEALAASITPSAQGDAQ